MIAARGEPGQALWEVPDRTFRVIDIPNHGREGETYMHHIVLRWETLVGFLPLLTALLSAKGRQVCTEHKAWDVRW